MRQQYTGATLRRQENHSPTLPELVAYGSIIVDQKIDAASVKRRSSQMVLE
jgi:hypothetical protein